MKLEEMVREFPQDFLSEEEMKDLIKRENELMKKFSEEEMKDFLKKEKELLEKEKMLLEKEIELTKKEIELTRKDTELMKKEIELIKKEKKNPIREITEFNPTRCNPWCDFYTEDGDCLLGWSCGDCGEIYGADEE